jgi:hypothetical protein
VQFEKVFAINLPARSDHRDAMSLASHFTGIKVDYIDGVMGDTVESKALPPGGEIYTTKGAIGAWRAHMNVLRKMVDENITSALIMEGDADWDIRIKSQLETFARASRVILQPQSSTFQPPTGHFTADIRLLDGHKPGIQPTTSPYGDVHNWDVLWLGHCGARMPPPDWNPPIPRFAILNDETVPEKQHIDKEFGDDQLTTQYPEHTRLISKNYFTLCTFAYAVTLPAARSILYELGVRRSSLAFDQSLSTLCNGEDDRPMLRCLSVVPTLFQHHRPIARKSSWSNIDKLGAEGDADADEPVYSKIAYTKNIRWSTQGNLRQLVYGDQNYTDLFRDGEVTPDLED